MVVFTCGHCGESVQKPKVEKHYLTKCRSRNPNLSCMDCFKDFYGNDYEQHTKCITEEQRYSAKGFVAKEKKGEQKQNVWVEMVQNVVTENRKTAPGNVLRILEAVSKHTNTPRKKPKFVNFVKNICGNKTNPRDIDGAWDLISVKLAELSNQNQNRNPNQNQANGKTEQNGKDEVKEETNGDITNGDTTTNGDESKIANGDAEENGDVQENGDTKKKSKKQLKEEKKRKKYEAELQSAAVLPEEDDEPTPMTKKRKEKEESYQI